MSRIVLPMLTVLQAGCAQLVSKNKSYLGGEAVEINGAEVRAAVKPKGWEGGLAFSAMVYSAGTATLDGPFKWRIEAHGREGHHLGMTVHRLRVTTRRSGRDEWYPEKYLGQVAPFRPLPDDPGRAFAAYAIPGELEACPEVDGGLRVVMDISVRTVKAAQRRTVRFALEPGEVREVEALFLPAEIVRSFGDRDPRDWHWSQSRAGD